MLKNLTILALAGALLPACILSTDDDTTTSASASDTTAGTTGGTGDGTTGGTTDGSGSDTVATESGTTVSPPTTGETVTTGEATTGGTTGGTTGPTSEYGMCGWVDADNFYGCAMEDGATPGAVDPMGIDPIGCPEGLVEGAACGDVDGPIGQVGCCMANGDVFFCDGPADGVVVKFSCGA